MWPFSKPKAEAPTIDRRRSLEGIPTVNEGASVTTTDAGTDTITITVKRGHGFLARFQPPVMERRVRLDELGTFVFRQIDGRRDARAIVALFVARYRVNRREAELSCIQFLKMLAGRQVISIVFK